jgi:hypothetical protein
LPNVKIAVANFGLCTKVHRRIAFLVFPTGTSKKRLQWRNTERISSGSTGTLSGTNRLFALAIRKLLPKPSAWLTAPTLLSCGAVLVWLFGSSRNRAVVSAFLIPVNRHGDGTHAAPPLQECNLIPRPSCQRGRATPRGSRGITPRAGA